MVLSFSPVLEKFQHSEVLQNSSSQLEETKSYGLEMESMTVTIPLRDLSTSLHFVRWLFFPLSWSSTNY